MSKDEQCADWAAHPLPRPQRHYAALDAVILEHIYAHICQNYQFEMVAYVDNFGTDY